MCCIWLLYLKIKKEYVVRTLAFHESFHEKKSLFSKQTDFKKCRVCSWYDTFPPKFESASFKSIWKLPSAPFSSCRSLEQNFWSLGNFQISWRRQRFKLYEGVSYQEMTLVYVRNKRKKIVIHFFQRIALAHQCFHGIHKQNQSVPIYMTRR